MGLAAELTAASVLIELKAGFPVQGFGAEVLWWRWSLAVELGHQHLYLDGSQLSGKNQGLSKGNPVSGFSRTCVTLSS